MLEDLSASNEKLVVQRKIDDPKLDSRGGLLSDQCLRTIVDSIGVGICGINTEGIVFFENSESARLLGRKPGELTGTHFHSQIQHHRPDGSPYSVNESPIFQTLADGRPRTGINDLLVRNDGTKFPISFSTNIIFAASGEIKGVAFSFLDVTDKQAAEGKLKEREERFRKAFDDAATGIAITTLDGHFVDTNRAFREMLGYTTKELNTLSIIEITHPDDRSKSLELVAQLIDGKRDALRFEKRYLHKSGRTIWTRISLSLHHDVDGNTIGLVRITEDITPQKEAEDALRRSEADLRFTARLSRLGSWTVSLPDLEVKWSEEASRIFDYPIGTYPSTEEGIDLYAEDSRERIQRSFEACISDGTPFDEDEVQLISLKGTLRFARVIGEAVRDDNGKIIGARGAIQDITDYVNARESLRTSEQRYALATEAAQASLWDWNLITNEVIFSDRFRQMIGYSREEFPDRVESLKRIVHADYQQSVEIKISDYLRSQNDTPVSFEFLAVLASGENRWMRTLGKAVWDEDGRPIRIVCSTIDITDSKIAAQQLAESEQRFRLLAKATNDAIWDWDLNSSSFWWSEGFETLSGFSRTEIESTIESWTTRIHPEDRSKIMEGVKNAIESGADSWSGEYRFVRKDQSYAYVLDRGYVIRDPDGKPVRMVGGLTDLTERRHLEAQLLQSQKMEAIGQLAGGVAHDFNNMLTVINGYSDLLLRKVPESDNMHKALTGIYDAGKRAEALTRQLLAFSRRQVLAPRIVVINTIIPDLGKMIGRLIGENIELKLQLSADLKHVEVDPGQFEQILINLAVNSRDAMPNGGKLLIETANVSLNRHYCEGISGLEPGNYVAISVSDTGVGIPAEVKQHIFEPFFTTKEIGKGTGLGLATVFGIVKQSGGHITLYSEVEVGTTFRIYLPITSDSEIHETMETAHFRDAPTGNEVVLLVEDEEAVREITSQTLEDCGYKVFEAQNGETALELLRTLDQPVDILVTDIIMPKIGGRELAKQVVELMPSCKVLLISGYTEDAVLMHGIMNEEFAFLQKPFTPAILAKKVRECLDSAVSG